MKIEIKLEDFIEIMTVLDHLGTHSDDISPLDYRRRAGSVRSKLERDLTKVNNED